MTFQYAYIISVMKNIIGTIIIMILSIYPYRHLIATYPVGDMILLRYFLLTVLCDIFQCSEQLQDERHKCNESLKLQKETEIQAVIRATNAEV